MKRREVWGFWRVLITILVPPLGVLIGNGLGLQFLLNIVLTLCGYLPGLIHAFWIQTRK
ncbi:YqaE/Pmp3 family membrane protein [Ewingella americana]